VIVWLIGLSGSGKTTIGTELVRQWREREPGTVLVDGDEVRRMAAESDDAPDHTVAGRRRNARRTIALCEWLDRQGLNVVCGQVALFEELRAAHRTRVSGYFEVFLDVGLDVVTTRDPKGLYAGGSGDVVGVDIPFPRPLAPDLVLDSSGAAGGPSALAAGILAALGRVDDPAYPYVPADFLASRPLYAYSETGPDLLGGWHAARRRVAAEWSCAAEPPAGSIGIHALLDELAAGGPAALDRVDLLVQRFEAGKRLYEHYRGEDLRGVTGGPHRELTRYVRFAEVLVAAYRLDGRLPHLNALLKVGDLLCSHAGEVPTPWRARAAAVLAAEAELVGALAEGRGVPCPA
jgi:cytidine diphosphoramidate kinase